MKLNKLTIWICFLLVIAFVEGCIVVYNLIHWDKNKFELDYQVYEVPVRSVAVKPFLFEVRAADYVDMLLDDVAEEFSNSLVFKFYKYDGAEVNRKAMAIDSVDYVYSEDFDDVSKANNGAALKVENNKPRIAIVIDDVGLSEPYVKKIEELDKPITASFLPYGASNKQQAERLKRAGHEIMLHVPMMPYVPEDLAPVTLSPEMKSEEIQKDLGEMFDRFGDVGLVGINNHMGSLFTEKEDGMKVVMELLKKRKMFFLDSMTTNHSVGKKVAGEYKVPYIARDVFLDNENDYDYIMKQLEEAENVAQKRGYAVVIGHPKSQTLRALADWIKDVEEKGFKLVHLSDLVKK